MKVCVFDAYGTLFDVAAAARTLSKDIGPSWETLSVVWRQKQLEYTWLRSMMGDYADFEQITADALSYALEVAKVPKRFESRLMDLYQTLEAYPEVPNVLQQIKDKGYQTAILSNGSPAMLANAVSSAGIGDLLDCCLSVDSLKYFKPLPGVYQMVVDQFKVTPDDVMFFSSNGWDISGAGSFGFKTLWVNRTKAPLERLPCPPALQVRDLSLALALIP